MGDDFSCNDPTGCDSWTEYSNCATAADHYYLDTNNIAQACADTTNCLVCNTSDNAQCITCIAGKYVDSDSSNVCADCTEVDPNCKYCAMDGSVCTECTSDTYYLSTAGACETKSPGCATSTTTGPCTEVNTGYYITGGVATKCGDHCNVCTDSSTCTTCETLYYPNNGACELCSGVTSFNCDECTSNAICTKCSTGFYLIDDGCVAETGCLAYSTSAKCTWAADGYYLDTGTATPCTAENCKTCASDTCTVCNDTFYIDTTCKTCVSAIPGCSTCTNATTCTECLADYYLSTTDNKCYSDANCTAGHSSTTICTAAATGYYIDSTNGEVKQCITGCKVCSTTDAPATKCAECYDNNGTNGYWLDGTTCTECNAGALTNCAKCTDASTCTECNTSTTTGYYLNTTSHTCVECTVADCTKCSADENTCEECIEGKYVK